MAALSTIALVGGVAALSAGGSIYQGEQQRKAASKSLKQQEQAQAEARTAALREQRIGEERINAANARKADPSAILAMQQAAMGGSPTMLSSATGVDARKLKLGQTGPLGV